MRERLRAFLPPALKLWLKRAAFRAVRLPLRLGARAVHLAERVRLSAAAHGVNLREAWDVKAAPRPPYAQQYGATDFLLLMDALAGRRGRMPTPGRAVRTSIILLCYNKVELTFQCLRSLLREVDLADAEIIVVNNASTDETREVLSHFEGYVRVLDNEENLGFVHGNNRGAELARGKYLLFLNNDTVVLPGWLERLAETAEADPRVGVVGPMFIYPDWTIQEAGGIVWNDARASQYGWGRSPDDRRFNFAREVDYVSGASLLVRKDLFDRLGGFDRRYAPIYYEDTDLCMAVRALGYKVVCQPASRIVHFEGATSGTDMRTGLKRYQALNYEKFRDKWREVLGREHLPPDPSAAERAANRKWDCQVAVFDDRIPTPDRDAGSARMLNILRALSEWCHPVFITASKHVWPEYEKRLWREGIETASSLELRRLMKTRHFRAAVVSRPEVAERVLRAIRRADPRVKVVYDTVDLHFLRLAREAELTGDRALAREAERYREVETRLARASDLVWFASSTDMEVMGREAPGVPSVVVPTIHRPHGGGLPFAEREHLLFVGNFRHRPNEDGVRFFIREVLPKVREELPGVELLLVGEAAPQEFSQLSAEGVRLMGYVPDVDPLFARARVFVAPIRFGAGIKGKIGEALAYAIPLVTTTVGAEGMSLRDGEEALIADTAREFAAAVVRLYRDEGLWRRLASNAHAHVERHFSPRVVGRVVNDSVKGLLGGLTQPPAAPLAAANARDEYPT
jgi:GT2 family glycosyltransferase